jgi:hypothetical protein
MGGFVKRNKELSNRRFELANFFQVGVLFLTLTLTVLAPFKASAQDDVPVSDDELVVPGNAGMAAPPVMIDEGDSGSVSDVEEYDG